MSALGEGSAPLVCPFYYRGDDSRPMRVAVTADNEVTVEEQDGHDALGNERWCTVDLDAMDPDVSHADVLLTEPHEWVAMVVLAVAYEFSKGGETP